MLTSNKLYALILLLLAMMTGAFAVGNENAGLSVLPILCFTIGVWLGGHR